jgi:hypothetical protein
MVRIGWARNRLGPQRGPGSGSHSPRGKLAFLAPLPTDAAGAPAASAIVQVGTNRTGWPKSPRSLAGRLRRAQTFLRAAPATMDMERV